MRMTWNMHILHVDEQLLGGSDDVLVYQMNGQSIDRSDMLYMYTATQKLHLNEMKMLLTIMICHVHMYFKNITQQHQRLASNMLQFCMSNYGKICLEYILYFLLFVCKKVTIP